MRYLVRQFLLFAMPLYITYTYQLIPVPVRKAWGMRGSGSSHIVIGTAMSGEADNLWPVFLHCCGGIVYLPGYMLGSLFRLTGLSKVLFRNAGVADPNSINWLHLS